MATKARAKRPRFKPSYRGIGELLRSDMLEADMLRRAEKGKALAETIAPVVTGHFRDSLYAGAEKRGGSARDRARGFVGSDDEQAFRIEYGTSDTEAHRTLRKALDAMGD